MVNKVLNTILKNRMVAPGEKVLCAFSGGADSLCLIDILRGVADKLSVTVAAAHLNHMLRGDESLRDEEFVREYCNKNNIELYSERVEVESISRKTKKSIELAARDERYSFFTRAKSALNAQRIATAHNADDNIETVIFNMTRGTGLRGLCGIPIMRGDIIRPLIMITKAEILNYLRGKKLEFVEDSSNTRDIYTRNKIRHAVIPVLKTINSNAVGNVARMTTALRDDEEYLQEQAGIYLNQYSRENNSVYFPIKILNELHPSVARRVITRLSEKACGNDKILLEFEHIYDIILLAKNQSPSVKLNLPKNMTVSREYDKIVFKRGVSKAKAPALEFVLSENETIMFGDHLIKCLKTKKNEGVNNSLNTFYISCDKIEEIPVVRARITGDKIKLRGRPEKSLKKLFIEQKIPADIRDFVPVIADRNRVLAVCGVGVDERVAARYREPAFCVTIVKGKTENAE